MPHKHEWRLKFALGDTPLKIEPWAFCTICAKQMMPHEIEKNLGSTDKFREGCENALLHWHQEWGSVGYHPASRFRKEFLYFAEILGVTIDVEKSTQEMLEISRESS